MDISALQEFYHGFYITSPEGNNAFSYEQRSNKEIYVPPLIKGSLADVQLGDRVVFSDVVDGVEVNVQGLKDFVHAERPGQDIFIFDHHNHAFSFWAAGVEAGLIVPGSTLVHVDQHKDTRGPVQYLGSQNEGQEPFWRKLRYANHVLNVGNFIAPALKLGWFSDVVQVGSAEAFEQELKEPFILDIDLDIFSSIMDYIPENMKVSRLREWIADSSFITIATSPFFMDQSKALYFVRILLER